MRKYKEFIVANGPNVFDKCILKRLRKAYSNMFWEDTPSDICAIIYHDIYGKPLAWYNPKMRWGYFPE